MTQQNFILLLLIGIFIGLTLTIKAQSMSEQMQTGDSTKYSIENCVNEFSMDKIEKTKVGYQYWFADKKFADGKTLKMSVVQPDTATHAPHKHSEDEFFFVLEGTAEFYLNGEKRIVEKYTSLYCPSNVEHGIRNVGKTELKYLVIKKYENVH